MTGICAVGEGGGRGGRGGAESHPGSGYGLRAIISSFPPRLGESEEHSPETKQDVAPEFDQTNKVSGSRLFISLQREAMNLPYCCGVLDYVTAQWEAAGWKKTQTMISATAI